MKKILLLTALLMLISSCSTQNSVNDEKRTIRENVVVVRTDSEGSVLSTGRHAKWYKVGTPLNEGMSYEVTLEIPRQREKTEIISALIVDFHPGEFINRDVYGRYKMAYSKLKSGSVQ